MKLLLLAVLFITACSVTRDEPSSKPVDRPTNLTKKVKLWSTYYFTPEFATNYEKKYCLRDKKGTCITGNLTLDEWCMVGLQGTGRVDHKTYTYSTRSDDHRVPCEKSFLKKASFAYSTGKIKFYLTKHKEGHGNKSNPLTAYKSIACDQKIYKYGQKFYIPAINKVMVCEDVGGAIKGNHIDTFIGLVDLSNPENLKIKYKYAFSTMPKEFRDIIKSVPEGTFDAYLLEE